ncbi:hypothetical protein [Phascolarctobacterium succinatutens]|uniref:hypothetical protein n=1 Tax=Phascolarctobacterium succinatutens TaxID=626940 RepID=UPI0040271336
MNSEQIYFEGHYGPLRFNKIQISNSGITLGSKFYPTECISGFQYKAVNTSITYYHGFLPLPKDRDNAINKLFTLPTGSQCIGTITTYGNSAFQADGNKHILEFGKDTYKKFVEVISALFFVKISKNILMRLQTGESLEISPYASITDTGLKIEFFKLLGKNTIVFYTWNSLRQFMHLGYVDGKFTIEINDKSRNLSQSFDIGYILNDNMNILESLLEYTMHHNIIRLSTILTQL